MGWRPKWLSQFNPVQLDRMDREGLIDWWAEDENVEFEDEEEVRRRILSYLARRSSRLQAPEP
jgi:hypothetical protein